MAEPLTNAMVEYICAITGWSSESVRIILLSPHLCFQEKFTQEMQPHYIYSPRELTRSVRGMFEAIQPLEDLTCSNFVRLWAHETLRLFQDRLVDEAERKWTDEHVDRVAETSPGIQVAKALQRPILYSNWLTKNYLPVTVEQLREFTKSAVKGRHWYRFSK